MGPGEVAAILFGTFGVLVLLRVPVAFALGLACIPVFFIEPRLTPFVLLQEMFKSYNAFVLLAVPFFLLAANLMNSAGITCRAASATSTWSSRCCSPASPARRPRTPPGSARCSSRR
jgi:TRAP-type mannitol/chloroaromatic compound transport system permease large subunit